MSKPSKLALSQKTEKTVNAGLVQYLVVSDFMVPLYTQDNPKIS